jgi:anti-sigma factor RsiW
MECNLLNRDELISAYLTGELPDDDMRIFEEHYFQCYTCFRELKIAEDAATIIREGDLKANRKE